jgi:hypothetical protein
MRQNQTKKIYGAVLNGRFWSVGWSTVKNWQKWTPYKGLKCKYVDEPAFKNNLFNSFERADQEAQRAAMGFFDNIQPGQYVNMR